MGRKKRKTIRTKDEINVCPIAVVAVAFALAQALALALALALLFAVRVDAVVDVCSAMPVDVSTIPNEGWDGNDTFTLVGWLNIGRKIGKKSKTNRMNDEINMCPMHWKNEIIIMMRECHD